MAATELWAGQVNGLHGPERKPSLGFLMASETKRNKRADGPPPPPSRPLPQEPAAAAAPTTPFLMVASPSSPAWSVAVRLRHRAGLEIRASAENVLPGWGRGGERLSLLLRLRRRLVLAVTSQCGPRAPASRTPPPGCQIIRFLRTRWARVLPIWRWRRKNKPPARAASAALGVRSKENRSLMWTIQRNRAWTPASPATLRFASAAVAVVLASVAALFYLKGGHGGGGCQERVARCASWRCLLTQFLEPPSLRNYKWLLRLLKWLLHK